MKVISVCLKAAAMLLLILLLGLLQEVSGRVTVANNKSGSGKALITELRTSQSKTTSDNNDVSYPQDNSDHNSDSSVVSGVTKTSTIKHPPPHQLFGTNSVEAVDLSDDLVRDTRRKRNTIIDDDDEEDDDEDDDDEEDEDEDDAQDYEWSEADLEMIKQKILDGLGLTTVPQKTKANFTKDEYDSAYSEYIRLVQEEEARMADSLLKEFDEEDEEEESDLLRELEEDQSVDPSPSMKDYRFYSTGVSSHSKKHGRGRRSTRPDGKIVHFHVSVPVRRVYSHDMNVKQAICRLWKTGGPVPKESSHDEITVSIFKMDENGRRRKRRKQQPVLLQSLNVSVTGDEWLSVDVTDAVQEWVNSPKGDAGVLVQCPDCAAAGVTIHTGADTSNTTHVPTLDVQTQVAAGRRVKRSKELTRATKAKWRRRGDCRNVKRNGNRRSRCCRRSMKVRFKDLPSFDFVESPEEFDAYYCSGRCPARFNPANEHALLQSLLKLQRREEIPRPCCAPTALQGLHILHVNEHGKLTTTYWSDVIVTECGCA